VSFKISFMLIDRYSSLVQDILDISCYRWSAETTVIESKQRVSHQGVDGIDRISLLYPETFVESYHLLLL
jgi:hypothetical protein